MASSSYPFFVLLVVGLMQSVSEIRGQPRIADTIGSDCSAPGTNPSYQFSCLVPNTVCTPLDDGLGTWRCTCRPGMEPHPDKNKCIYDATIPLNATECEDSDDCSASGTVCRVNRGLPSAVPGAPRPAPSSTGKRCQCAEDKAFDPMTPYGCNAALTLTGGSPAVGCQGRGGNTFCKARNPEYVCVSSGPGAIPANVGKCMCPLSAPLDDAVTGNTLACKNPNLKTCTTDTECTTLPPTLPWDLTTADVTSIKCDVKLKKCVCIMRAQAAAPSTTPTLAVPEIPVSTPGSLVYTLTTSKCSAIRATSSCYENADCATQFSHSCWRPSPTNTTAPGTCMCPPLKRFGFSGLTCNDAFGKCCIPSALANTYQCGLPVTPTPGVSNLSCLPNSLTCGCAFGFYSPRVGCVSIPPTSGQLCDTRS